MYNSALYTINKLQLLRKKNHKRGGKKKSPFPVIEKESCEPHGRAPFRLAAVILYTHLALSLITYHGLFFEI